MTEPGTRLPDPPPTMSVDASYIAASEMFIGPIPGGMQLDHLCRVRCCANPTHAVKHYAGTSVLVAGEIYGLSSPGATLRIGPVAP